MNMYVYMYMYIHMFINMYIYIYVYTHMYYRSEERLFLWDEHRISQCEVCNAISHRSCSDAAFGRGCRKCDRIRKVRGDAQRYTATHCNTLQSTAKHCNTLRHASLRGCRKCDRICKFCGHAQQSVHCNTPCNTHCNTHCNTQ